MILLITNKEDVTTDFIVNRLNKTGALYFRLNTEDLISKIGVNFDVEKKEYIFVNPEKKIDIDLSIVRSVYYRRPKLPQIILHSLSKSENEFVVREIAYLIEGLYTILKDRFWISPVYSIRKAENKIYQLLLAQEIGFEIPISLITTFQNKAELFLKRFNGECITKPIRSGKIDDQENPKVVFTSLMTNSDIAMLEGVKNCPTYLQNKIKKEADIRVTVVGKKIFSTKIYSQEYKETTIDWRKGENIKIKHEKIKLPRDIEDKCVKLVDRLGLNFGAIDFILDNDKRYIFLEINPNGQWGWIEKRLGYDISGEIVRLLLKGGKD